MTRPRKPKVKCTDWEKEYGQLLISTGIEIENVRRQRNECMAEVASLTEQIKAKDARIAELEDKIQKAKTLCDKWDELCTARAEQVNRLTADLQATRDLDDELMAAQRERLIRLTEIKNIAGALVTAIDQMWRDSTDKLSWELNGTAWVKHRNVFPVIVASDAASKGIAALEVDSTLPAIPPKGTK